MLCWDSDMPDEVARAYAIWNSVAAGNVSETARLLDMRRPTVQEWSQRYRWKERQAEQRQDDRDRTIANAWARMTTLVDKALTTVDAALDARLGPDGKPQPGDPTSTAVRSAFNTLATFGITPQRAATLTVQSAPPVAISDAELDAILASGNTAALLALASGKPLPPSADAVPSSAAPPHPLPPPRDFTASRPGGRAGSGPHPSVTKHSELADSGEDAAIDAEFRDVGGFDADTAQESEPD